MLSTTRLAATGARSLVRNSVSSRAAHFCSNGSSSRGSIGCGFLIKERRSDKPNSRGVATSSSALAAFPDLARAGFYRDSNSWSCHSTSTTTTSSHPRTKRLLINSSPPLLRLLSSSSSSSATRPRTSLSQSHINMAKLTTQLKAPNGVEFTLPTGLFINNEFVEATGGKITSISPINGEEICSVEAASPEDINVAVKAAQAAFEEGSEWRELTGGERGQLMHKLADLLEKHRQVLATIETWDNGKPYSVAFNDDLGEVIGTLRYYAGWADKIHGQTIPTSNAKFAYTLRQPVGVCAQIIPWNYPLAMAAWKLGPALATGNTIVLKPAEQTPLSILYVADLVRQAGFPPGVVNVVNGYGKDAGKALASHPEIRKIAFTGSTATGREIMKTAAINMKNITLETGGKSPLLVFDDADIEQAARWAYVGILSNQGQVCTATSRLLVHESVKEKFVKAFTDYVIATAKTGDPFAEDTTHGPQVSEVQYNKVLSYVETAKKEGAKLELGGESAQKGLSNGKGYFIQPTIFSNVTRDMTIFQEEVFGPLVAITLFKDEKEAIKLANDSEYGLAAAVFSENISRAHRVAASLEAGMVWINSSNDSEIQVPFGGVKQSGIGRELGEAGLSSYLETKAIHVNLGSKL